MADVGSTSTPSTERRRERRRGARTPAGGGELDTSGGGETPVRRSIEPRGMSRSTRFDTAMQSAQQPGPSDGAMGGDDDGGQAGMGAAEEGLSLDLLQRRKLVRNGGEDASRTVFEMNSLVRRSEPDLLGTFEQVFSPSNADGQYEEKQPDISASNWRRLKERLLRDYYSELMSKEIVLDGLNNGAYAQNAEVRQLSSGAAGTVKFAANNSTQIVVSVRREGFEPGEKVTVSGSSAGKPKTVKPNMTLNKFLGADFVTEQFRETPATWFGAGSGRPKMAMQGDPRREMWLRPDVHTGAPGGWDCVRLPSRETQPNRSAAAINAVTQDPNDEATYKLTVDILKLEFDDHHLYNEECRLAHRVDMLCRQFRSRLEPGTWDEFSGEKRWLLKLDSITASMNTIPASEAEDVRQARIRMLRVELRNTRQQIDEERSQTKQLFDMLLAAWEKLKTVRTSQGFSSTKIKLQYQEKPNGRTKDEEESNQRKEVNAHVEEMNQEFKDEQKRAEQLVRRLQDAKVKLEKAARDAQAAGRDGAAEMAKLIECDKRLLKRKQKDLAYGYTLESPFNEVEQKKELEDQYTDMQLRAPGKPILIPLCTTVARTDIVSSAVEISRREKMHKTSWYVRILLDDETVDETSKQAMHDGLAAPLKLEQSFPMRLIKAPGSIKLQVWETAGTFTDADQLIAEVYVDTSFIRDKDSGRVIPTKIERSHHHDFSGSVPYQEADQPKTSHFITGALDTKVIWDSLGAGYEAGSASDRLTPHSATSSKRNFVAGKANLDPNDPRNISLLESDGHASAGDEATSLSFFRILEEEDDLKFATSLDNDEQQRIELIQLRDEQGVHFGYKSEIPLHGYDITDDMFRSEEERQNSVLMGTRRSGTVQTQERGQLLADAKRRQAGKNKKPRVAQTADHVREVELPNFQLNLDFIWKLLEPRRPLRPTPKEWKATSFRPATATIVVQVICATNVPPRIDNNPRAQQHEDGSSNDNVQPFVEVRYKTKHGEVEKRTSSTPGCNPQWNRTLEIEVPLPPPEEDLLDVTECLEFNVFDEITKDAGDKDEARSSNVISERREKRWLAHLSLPFATIYRQKRVEGLLRLEVPSLNLGYKNSAANQERGGPWFEEATAAAPTLKFFVTLDPPLELSVEEAEDVPSAQDEKLVLHCQKWTKDMELLEQSSGRKFEILCNQQSDLSVFVSRFLRSDGLEPPADFKSEKAAIRFVTMVPFIDDWQDEGEGGKTDVWESCQEFLGSLSGDWEEHAVLLCNYFKHLHRERETYVALGTGIPEGQTAYVLTKEESRGKPVWILVNPSSGESFSSDDRHCAMIDIAQVFNHENCWGNMQPQMDDLRHLNFNFTDPKLWKPIFDNKFQRALNEPGESVQATFDPSVYVQRPLDDPIGFLRTFEGKLMKKLQMKFEQWRSEDLTPPQMTSWIRAQNVLQGMQTILTRCEKGKRGEAIDVSDASELEQIMHVYSTNGFPINQTFSTDEAQLISKSTGDRVETLREFDKLANVLNGTDIHDDQDSDVQFSLAVKAELYPCGIISVWVFAMALEPRQRR